MRTVDTDELCDQPDDIYNMFVISSTQQLWSESALLCTIGVDQLAKSKIKVGGTITFEDTDGNIIVNMEANREKCMHSNALVTGISNPDELDPLDIFFNPLPFFLFLLFSVSTGIASTGVFVGASKNKISYVTGIVVAIGSSKARSMVVVVANTIGISGTESKDIIG
ncbi:hypothetical protein Scep_028293 [Stephania cephalantha]|uniref:Uncharacterized protein n=1 Tax=Stephania cephalantha TaxID=152367 RepID=A0AAP0E9P8_9MAGN